MILLLFFFYDNADEKTWTSNRITPTGFWNQRVYLFHHIRVIIRLRSSFQSIYPLRDLIVLQTIALPFGHIPTFGGNTRTWTEKSNVGFASKNAVLMIVCSQSYFSALACCTFRPFSPATAPLTSQGFCWWRYQTRLSTHKYGAADLTRTGIGLLPHAPQACVATSYTTAAKFIKSYPSY